MDKPDLSTNLQVWHETGPFSPVFTQNAFLTSGPKNLKMKKIILQAVFISGLLSCVSAQPPFKILKTFHIASTGGWDYLAVGPGNNRLYVSHGTQVNILDKTSGDSIGVIENTTGVHGIAFVKELNKGFTSNGRLNNVTVFDLTTNAIITQIATGEN